MTGRTVHACQAEVAQTSASSATSVHPRLVLLATILASSLDYVDGSAINVGLPAIGRSLHAGAADLQWAINAYLLPLSALLLFGGGLGDRFGRSRLLAIGVAVFAAGSAACAAATGLEWLILARGLQGLGAALVLPNSLALLGETFDGPARNRAVGLWAATASMAAAIGPVLGGWLIDTVGWRAIFLINLPLAAATVAVLLYAVKDGPKAGEAARLDLGGAALISTSLLGLVWGLTQGAGPGGWTLPAVAAVGGGGLFAGAYLRTEKRKGERAMTPLALFGSRPLVALNLLTLLLYGALTVFMLLLPYLLITVLGYSATGAGAALLPFPIVMSLAAPVAGEVSGRIGVRPLLVVGPLLVACGFALSLLALHGAGYWTGVLPCVLAVALGMSCVAGPLTTAVIGAVDARHTGVSSGLNSALAQLGGVVGIALIGGALAAHGPAFVAAFGLVALSGAVTAIAASIAGALSGAGRTRPGAGLPAHHIDSDPQPEGASMSRITYEIVEHDGGWAYRADGVYSETYPNHDAARAAAERAAGEQRVSGEAEGISWEDKDGRWHDEVVEGDDRPATDVEG